MSIFTEEAEDSIGPLGNLCGTHGFRGERAWHHDFDLDRKVWTPPLVMECWTCGGYHTNEDERNRIRKPMPIKSAENLIEHRSAGHDVRPVRERGKE